MSTTDTALAAIREEIATQQEAREVAAASLKAIDVGLRSLRSAERALDPSARRQPGAPRETATDAVRKIMGELGTATQHQVAQALGKPKNTARHALDQLVEQGVIKATGRKVERSPEFELVAAE